MYVQKNVILQVLELYNLKPYQKFKLKDGYTKKVLGMYYFNRSGYLCQCFSKKWDNDFSCIIRDINHIHTVNILNGIHLIELKDG